MRRRLIVSVVAIAGLMAVLAGSARAEDKKPDATISLSEGSVAVGIGWSWGKGTLSYQGKTYSVKIDGLAVAEVGVTKAEATGNVYNLTSLDDLDGVYAAASAGGTAGKGMSVTSLRNSKGVVINLTSTTKGASLKIAAEGLKIKLQK